jgi:hypothetical protein
MFKINIFDENILRWIKGFFINILLAILIITKMVLLARFVK